MTVTISDEALFRYRIVSLALALILQGKGKTAAVRTVCDNTHTDHRGRHCTVSKRTLFRWLSAYQSGGIAGLERKQRETISGSQALKDDFLLFLRTERNLDASASIPELIERAREHNLIGADQHVDRVTVWRTMRRMELDTSRSRLAKGHDMRRFSYPRRLQMVLSDFKHFRAGASKAKRVAIYFLDDHSRFALGAACSTSENADIVLLAFHDLLNRWGRISALYVDRGPGYICEELAKVCASLDIPLIHGKARYPQGHGKIERFNRSLKARVLRSLTHPDVDSDLGALTLRLRHDIYSVYNHRKHEGLDNETPHRRFFAEDQAALRPIEQAKLELAFRIEEERTVSNDHVVRMFGEFYEVPRGLAGQRISVWRHLLEHDEAGRQRLTIDHEGRTITIHPVDPQFNATSGRAHPEENQASEAPPVPTASSRRFERELRPMTGPEGDFPKQDQE